MKTISELIHEWIDEVVKEYSSFDEMLNQGFCADLATWLSEVHIDSKSFIWHDCNEPCHVWIEYQGRHYDMQNPDGVENWQEMAYFTGSPNAKIT